MTSQPLLLLVDDDPRVLDLAARCAEGAGYAVLPCPTGADALAALRTESADVALVDLRMPDIDGLQLMREIRGRAPACRLIASTSDAGIDTAIEATRLGAVDYLAKPFDFDRLRRSLLSARGAGARAPGDGGSDPVGTGRAEFCGMIGPSPIMQEIFTLIRRLAPHVRTALVTGETGTGKELAARALHRTGPRRDRRFVAINCSAVVETLFESELFGHVRGAFTGATDAKPGLFELADGGTLFLDEIGELPLGMQAKLLRVLETGEVQRVGSLEARRVDVHVFASTNRDLRAEVAAARFRSDLYHRLNVVEIRLPPLRCRRGDIPYLVAAFVRDGAARLRKALLGVTPGAERVLVGAPWDGNVRELRNVVERACILAEQEFIDESDLVGLAASPLSGGQAPGEAVRVSEETSRLADQDSLLADIERDHILRTLRRAGGNKKAAARLLGLSRRALYRRLERHQLGSTISRRAPAASAPVWTDADDRALSLAAAPRR